MNLNMNRIIQLRRRIMKIIRRWNRMVTIMIFRDFKVCHFNWIGIFR